MNIYIVRHCECSGNLQGALSCDPDDGLTRNGMHQSLLISDWLQTFTDIKIWTSPVRRCLDSIMPFLKQSGSELTIKNNLNEGQLNFSRDLIAQPPRFRPYRIPDNIYNLLSGESDDPAIPESDETVEEFVGRVELIWEEIKQVDVNNLIIITHGHFIRELLNRVLKTSSMIRFPVNNCSVSLIYLNSFTNLVFVNRTLQYEKKYFYKTHLNRKSVVMI